MKENSDEHEMLETFYVSKTASQWQSHPTTATRRRSHNLVTAVGLINTR